MNDHYDICVYGATSGGVVAAVAMARMGYSVALVEPTRHVGGMSSGGLGWTDGGRFEKIGGMSAAFYREVSAFYKAQRIDEEASRNGGHGWSHEPHVAEGIFRRWLSNARIEPMFACRVASVQKDGRRITSIVVDRAAPDERGTPTAKPDESGFATIRARMFVDASYEGDLMALAGVPYTTRRESRDQYNESMAGIIYHHHETLDGKLLHVPGLEAASLDVDPFVVPGDPSSGLLPFLDNRAPLTPGCADDALQAYNFRLCLTADPYNSMPVEPVGAYDPQWFELLGRWLAKRESEGDPIQPGHFHHFGLKPLRVFKISPLPHGKSDVNNAHSFISSDFVGQNYAYPEADWAHRAHIWRAHEDYQRGLHYFMQTDARVPPEVRIESRKWGLAKDEFADTGHWPFQLYVRESRRMVGDLVMTQNHVNRQIPVDDSIGMGSYSLDSHLCRRFVHQGRVYNEGGFLFRNGRQAYPISYRALLPKASECENLASLFCLSASHAAFSTLRMEPVLMILGQSVAIAIDMALERNVPLAQIPIPLLQLRLLDAGQILM
jgi:hypothetical protein